MKSQTFQKFVFVLITLLIITGQSFSENASKEAVAIIRECIQEQVNYPDLSNIIDGPCSADILFIITAEGELCVKSVTTENQVLSKYITERVSAIRFCCLESPVNQYYRIKLTFSLI